MRPRPEPTTTSDQQCADVSRPETVDVLAAHRFDETKLLHYLDEAKDVVLLRRSA